MAILFKLFPKTQQEGTLQTHFIGFILLTLKSNSDSTRKILCGNIFLLVFVLGHTWHYSGVIWFCTEELLLAVLRGSCGMLVIQPRLVLCKATFCPLYSFLPSSGPLFLNDVEFLEKIILVN